MNNGIYNLLKESIYHIEAQCDEITEYIVNKEGERLRDKLINYNYPEDSVQEAIIEFTNYFQKYFKNNLKDKM
jgi:CRISPR/Cas system CMR subunit Cmr6 (Cas7 group RAMP superfamily)